MSFEEPEKVEDGQRELKKSLLSEPMYILLYSPVM